MTTMNLFDMTDTWNASGTTFDAIKMNVTDTASAAGSLLLDLQIGGSSRFKIRKDGLTTAAGFMNTAGFRSTIDGGFYITDSTSPGAGNNDIALVRDAANTLAQRNGTNAQTFRVYSTYTDASNNRRAEFGTDGNGPFVQSIGVGTGNGANFSVLAQAALFLGSNGAATWQINTSGHFLAATDNTFDIGANGANRPRNVFWAGYQEMSEMTAPAAPATNNVRIYAEDNGSGKTRLMARFATGAAVQIAIEP